MNRGRFHSRWQSYGLPCLVFVAGLLASFSGWFYVQKTVDQNLKAYFDFRVREISRKIENRLDTYQQVLYGARSLFLAEGIVSRESFHKYIDGLFLDQRYPGIQGVGFSLIVPSSEKEQHIQLVRRQGFANYRIRPESERELYTSIVYLEPFKERNLRAFGYDMFSEPVRNKAMSYARDHNTIGMSGKVTLVQETDSDVQAGFLLYLPVYNNGLPYESEQQRRDAIIGWVYSPFRMRDFIASIGGELSMDLHLSIYDGELANEWSLMYVDETSAISPDILINTQRLTMGGQTWTLVVHSQPSLMSRLNDDRKPLFVLIGGIFFTLLLTLLTRQLIARGQSLRLIEQTNVQLRESEARFRLMADSAPVLIWLVDVNHQAIWFNRAWLDFTGRSMDQECGQGWLISVNPEHLDLVEKTFNWHMDMQKPFSIEHHLRNHEGEYRWLVNHGVPRYDEKGQFVGFIGSCVDISSHKEMEAELWELATTDGLTGFLNRRHFFMRFQNEFARIQRNPELYCAVLMFDLDHFKQINDSFGHAVGDVVLKHFAHILREEQRAIDVVGRIGGEEFAILLPDTDLNEARIFAERVRLALVNLPLSFEHGKSIAITVSIGIALLDQQAASIETVLANADRALYAAKGGGRNQVKLWQKDVESPPSPFSSGSVSTSTSSKSADLNSSGLN